MLNDQLKSLGFSPNEATVYIALQELGSARAGALIKKTGLHRNIVYEALERLVERRLVSKVIRRGVAEFQALDPRRLVEEARANEQLAESVAIALSERRREGGQQEVEVYQGVEGIKTHRLKSLDVLRAGEEILIMGGAQTTNKPLNAFWQSYHRRRAKKGVGARILFNADSRSYGREREEVPHTAVHYLPEAMSTPAFWEIWGDYVGIGTMEGEPVLLSIKNATVANGFRSYFNLLWSQKVKTFEGIAAVKQVFQDILATLSTGDEYLVLGATWGGGVFDKEMYEFFHDYHTARQKKGIRVKLLFGESSRTAVNRFRDNYTTLAHVRFLPQDVIPTMQMTFYRDVIHMVVWQDPPLVFSIQNQKMVDNFRAYFQTMWAGAVE